MEWKKMVLPRLVKPLAQFRIFCTELVRQLSTKSLVFCFEFYEILQLITLMRDKWRALLDLIFPVVVSLLADTCFFKSGLQCSLAALDLLCYRCEQPNPFSW